MLVPRKCGRRLPFIICCSSSHVLPTLLLLISSASASAGIEGHQQHQQQKQGIRQPSGRVTATLTTTISRSTTKNPLLMRLDPFVKAKIEEVPETAEKSSNDKSRSSDDRGGSVELLPEPRKRTTSAIQQRKWQQQQQQRRREGSSSRSADQRQMASGTNASDSADLPWPHPNSLFHSHSVVASLTALLILGLILATVLGNLGVCLAIGMVRKLKAQPANLLLISLALADFCVGLFVMPMAAVYVLEERWVFGEFLCRFWVTADLTLCTASILNLCAISVDRHLAVTRALRYSANRTRRRICMYICVVWLGALLVSAAPLAFLPFPQSRDQQCQVSQNRYYQIYATIISFWGPSLIMVIVYFKLWSAAKRMQRQDRLVLRWQGISPSEQLEERPVLHQHHQNGTVLRGSSVARANAHFLFALRRSAHKFRQEDKNNNNNNSSGNGNQPRASTTTEQSNNNNMSNGRASAGSTLGAIRIPLLSSHKPLYEDKARKTLGVIMSVFIICWVPFFILALAKSQHWVADVPRWLDALVLWLGYSNSMLNPLIYCKYNREFRIPFGEMICCRFSTIQDVMRNESYYMKFGSPRISESRSGPRSARNGQVIRTDRSLTQQAEAGQQQQPQPESLMVDARRLSSKRNSSPCILLES